MVDWRYTGSLQLIFVDQDPGHPEINITETFDV